MQAKAEQLACFAQTFIMALELVHSRRLQNQNDGAAGGNLQIKGRYYYNEIRLQCQPFFFQRLADKGIKRKKTWKKLLG